MTNILTAAEGAIVLRCEATDPDMLQLLPLVDMYIQNATGRDWAADGTIYSEAKAAARILLTRWHEDPGGMSNSMGPALTAALTQLEAKALALETAGIPDDALALVSTNIAGEMAVTANLVLIFNHAMDSTATSAVSVETVGGVNVVTVNSLDATKKILTINPNSNLDAGTAYRIVITTAVDTYGQTLTDEIGFTTA